MKRIFTLCACFIYTVSLWAQSNRYVQEVFTHATRSASDIKYATNASVLHFPTVGEAVAEELMFDFYEPVGDHQEKRPLVIMLHSGSFLPVQVNRNVIGHKRDSFNIVLSQRLAKMGYVVANLEYRLGWNPFAQHREDRCIGLISAVYRGIQDVRTSIRYFKKTVMEEHNPYRIDTSRIVVWGVGTGSYLALGAAYLREFEEFMDTSFPEGKFLADHNQDGVPESPIIFPSLMGDLEGKTSGMTSIEGWKEFPPNDVFCIPNHIDYSSDFQLAVGMSGAIGDLSWVNEGETPVIAFHSPQNQVTPYEDGIARVWTNGDTIVSVQGVKLIVEKANKIGLNDSFSQEYFNDTYTEAARINSEKAGHPYLEGLFPMHQAHSPYGKFARGPWHWWDEAFWSQIPFNDSLSYHEAARIESYFAGSEQGRLYIDTIVGYFAPRAKLVLDLKKENDQTTAITVNDNHIAAPLFFPNPAFDGFNISWSENVSAQITLFSITGQAVADWKVSDLDSVFLERSDLPNGLYHISIKYPEGGSTFHRIVLN